MTPDALWAEVERRMRAIGSLRFRSEIRPTFNEAVSVAVEMLREERRARKCCCDCHAPKPYSWTDLA